MCLGVIQRFAVDLAQPLFPGKAFGVASDLAAHEKGNFFEKQSEKWQAEVESSVNAKSWKF